MGPHVAEFGSALPDSDLSPIRTDSYVYGELNGGFRSRVSPTVRLHCAVGAHPAKNKDQLVGENHTDHR